ncbi:MAG: hypothetical protein M3Q14_03435, partial [bacterium]|nr:hypothetical protein [bacterium]
ETAVPIASITKIVTALAVMQEAPFKKGEKGKTFTLTAADATNFNNYLARQGTVVPVNPGQTITQYHALQALLLASANNIADSLVRWHFGSMDAYLDYANDMIKNMGLSKTVIKDASGFSAQTVSTPSELIILGQEVLKQPVLAEIVTQSQATLPNIGLIKSTNRLLTSDGAMGIKTGSTDEAGYCLLFAAKHTIDKNNTVTVIGSVLNAPSTSSVFSRSSTLLQATKKGFSKITVVPTGKVIGTVSSNWSQKSEIVTDEPLTVYGWKGKTYTTTAQFETENTTINAGETVGVLKVDNYPASEAPLKSTAEVTEPDLNWRLRNYW